MNIKSKEHQDMMAMFERTFTGRRLDRECKSLWSSGRVYQHDETNNLFLAFRQGCAYGIAIAQ